MQESTADALVGTAFCPILEPEAKNFHLILPDQSPLTHCRSLFKCLPLLYVKILALRETQPLKCKYICD